MINDCCKTLIGCNYRIAFNVVVQVLQPPQQGAIVKPPQVTLTTTPMVTLRGQPHSHIVVGQPQVQLKQIQTGECVCQILLCLFSLIM